MIGTQRHDGAVHEIRLDRTERRNALDTAHCRDLHAAVDAALADGARVLVLTGEGTAFCSGADLDTVGDPDFLAALYGMLHRLAEVPVPVVAAVHGPAIGAGTQLALAADLRVVDHAGVGYHLLVDLERRHRARPAAVDRQVRQKAGGLAGLYTVGESPAQVACKLRRLARRDQDRDGHQAAVAWRQLGPPPHIAEQHVVGERRQARRDLLLQCSRRCSGSLRLTRGWGCSGWTWGCAGAVRSWRAGDRPLYCSSLTFSIHCTAVPSRCSVIAMCVMDACGEAPCQCFWPAGILTTSPARISSMGSPHRWTRPVPAVTIRI